MNNLENILKNRFKLVVNNNIGLDSEAKDTSNSCIEEEIWSQILHSYNNRLMARRLKP